MTSKNVEDEPLDVVKVLLLPRWRAVLVSEASLADLRAAGEDFHDSEAWKTALCDVIKCFSATRCCSFSGTLRFNRAESVSEAYDYHFYHMITRLRSAARCQVPKIGAATGYCCLMQCDWHW